MKGMEGNMVEKDDWRIVNQEKYLMGKTLIFTHFRQPNEDWDHLHCIFCWDKFSESAEDLHAGYATLDAKYWVCPCCFEDLKDRFQWKLLPSVGYLQRDDGYLPPDQTTGDDSMS
jgi:hypothetical protein